MTKTAAADKSWIKLDKVSEILSTLDGALRDGKAKDLLPVSTAFHPLDEVLGGGLRAGNLILLGGTPGVGKTVAALQWARNIALAGGHAIYACYEHEKTELMIRLLDLEIGDLAQDRGVHVDGLGASIQAAALDGGGLKAILSGELAKLALERLEGYSDRLWILRASGATTGTPELQRLIADSAGSPTVLFVDYLQKVALPEGAPTQDEKVTKITEALKEIALTSRIPLVCVVASDREGLKSRRLHLHHLRGSSSLAFESDVVIMLNEKSKSVSKVHLAYDSVRAKTFADKVIFSIEKNRGGPFPVDLEFRSDFGHLRFDPLGDVVTDKLVDERLQVE